MRGRKPDPMSPYRVRAHKANGYRYVATLRTRITEDGRRVRTYTHLGALDENDRFVPNMTFLSLPDEERRKLVFPDSWDLSEVERIRAQHTPSAHSVERDHASDLLFGDVWFLLEVARTRGVADDLLAAFFHREDTVCDLLALAAYACLTCKDHTLLERWQRSFKLPCAQEMTGESVERLTRSVSWLRVADLFTFRISRYATGPSYACVTPTRTLRRDHAGGEERYGAYEVVVYDLTSHEPVAYRAFPGDPADIEAVRTFARDLAQLGIDDVVVIFGDARPKIDELADAGISFLMGVEVEDERVREALRGIAWDRFGFPSDMAPGDEKCLFQGQYPLAGGSRQAIGAPVLNAYVDMQRRMEELQQVRLAVEDERKELEALSGNQLLARRRAINRDLRYHRVSFRRGADGTWKVGDVVGASDRQERDKTGCGFVVSVASGVHGDAATHRHLQRVRDEQEAFLRMREHQFDPVRPDGLFEDGSAERTLVVFVALILHSIVRATWASSAELRREFASPPDIIDEMRDIRWHEEGIGDGHMTRFSAAQVRICAAFGIEVPQAVAPGTAT